MKRLMFILLTLVFGYSCVKAQAERDIVTKDGFVLKSVFWEQDSASDAILLLHQCDADQSMYTNLANMFFNDGFHVITFDYRGIGKSITAEFNIEDATNKSEAWDKTALYSEKDLDAVMAFVKKRLGSKLASLSLLGASCGGDKVVYLAEKYYSEISAIGFLSSRLATASQKKIRKFSDKPMLFIAAKGDKRAYEASRNGMANPKTSSDSKIITYKGNLHAKSLFLKDRRLEETIKSWYFEVLNKK